MSDRREAEQVKQVEWMGRYPDNLTHSFCKQDHPSHELGELGTKRAQQGVRAKGVVAAAKESK